MAVQIVLQFAKKQLIKIVPTKKQFQQWAALAMHAAALNQPLQTMNLHHARIVIRLVECDESQHLNKAFRAKDYATNILSFPADSDYWEPDSRVIELGDLVLCVPIVLEEAAKLHLAAEHHWAHLIIHGCLHLLGYDHETLQEAQVMEALEIKLLAQIGIADPYALE